MELAVIRQAERQLTHAARELEAHSLRLVPSWGGDITSGCVLPMLRYPNLSYAMLFYDMLQYAMLRYATLPYDMLRYAILHYDTLCYAMLC